MDKENLIKHYWDCAGALDSEIHTHKLLKSYYMTICRKLAKSSICMPKEKFSHNNMCGRCSSKWNETNFKMKLKPQQIAQTTKAKKQLEKLYEAKKSTENRRALTRKQRKRAKWLRKRMLNSMEIQCELCQHITKLAMHKPSRKEREGKTKETAEFEESILPETVAPTLVKTKKKKNKSKDKSAGLKLEIVQSAAKKPKLKTDVIQNKINLIEQKVAAEIVKTKPSNKSVCKVGAPNKQAKHTFNLSQPLKAKKKKTTKAAVAPKVQSKTQQQNSLLQLAALLQKKNASKSDTNVAHNRLESLLK